jgi:hypothetical protein
MLHIHISSEAGEMGTLVAGVPSGLGLISAHEIKVLTKIAFAQHSHFDDETNEHR